MAKISLNQKYDLIRSELRNTILLAATHCSEPRGSLSDKTSSTRAQQQIDATNIDLLSLVSQYLELGLEAMKVLDKMEEDFRE
jgi:hypothetical protein